MKEQIHTGAIIIGSGMAGLTVACLLARQGIYSTILEQNWLPGGCSSSYPRKDYIFESGATTLVGLDDHMPLKYLLDITGIQLFPTKLNPPMRVFLKNGKVLTRYHNLDRWIAEAEKVFGNKGQRPFWEYCYKISQFVWQTSLQQKVFPPSNFSDLLYAARHFRPRQIGFATLAFQSMESLLKKFGLLENREFVDFVNEQLLITAQNHIKEVNVLFGATALCYTNYTNYYMPGGLLNLVNPLIQYLENRGSQIVLREPALKILPEKHFYTVEGKHQIYRAPIVISAIPINNTLDIFANDRLVQKYRSKVLGSESLNSAFQMGFVTKRKKQFDCLHHQIHLKQPLPYTQSDSIFLSLSHPEDRLRCGTDEMVGSVSTHIHHPSKRIIHDKHIVEEVVFDTLEMHDFIRREDIIYHHSATPKAWKKWTGRSWGFVGGYPQLMRIKPWQMIDARLDHKGAYLCGDSTYPGQGIPGACLSGIVAFEKMKLDGALKRAAQHNPSLSEQSHVSVAKGSIQKVGLHASDGH